MILSLTHLKIHLDHLFDRKFIFLQISVFSQSSNILSCKIQTIIFGKQEKKKGKRAGVPYGLLFHTVLGVSINILPIYLKNESKL